MTSRLPATPERAKQLAEDIIHSAQSLYESLYEFASIRGWEALGYRSFGAWAEENLPFSRWKAYQELARANALNKVSAVLGLPMSDPTVVEAAQAIPQHEAVSVAAAVGANDDETIDGVIVEDSTTPTEVIQAVRERLNKDRRPTTQDSEKILRAWARQCRRLAYPPNDLALESETVEALAEARDFIDDVLR